MVMKKVGALANYGKKPAEPRPVAPQARDIGGNSRAPSQPQQVQQQGQMVAPQARDIGAPTGSVRGKSVWDRMKSAIDTWDDPVTDAFKTAKRAVGLEPTPIPSGVLPTQDPNRIAALGQYGRMVQQQAGMYDPERYGPGYFQARKFTPQVTTPGTDMPGARQEQQVQWNQQGPQRPDESWYAQQLSQYGQRPQTQVQTEGQAGAPGLQMQGSLGMPNIQREQPGNIRLSQEAWRNAPVRQSEQGQGPGQLYSEAGQSLGARTLEGQQAAPRIQGEAGNYLDLQRVQNINPNIGGYEQAVSQELGRLGAPQQIDAGFDPEMRNKAIQLATSGIDLQKQQALERMKEEQMASGNYGSSVGQKQMADLAAQYDQQRANAMLEVDLQQMQAQREDRYRNIGVEQSRVGQVQSLAGAGAGLATGAADFQRSGVSMDNQARQIQEEYARQGRTIDNATAMQIAQFQREGRDIDFGRQSADAMFQREGRTMDQSTAERLAQYAREGRTIDYGSDMAAAQFDREGRAIDRQSLLTEEGLSRDARQTNRGIDQYIADLQRQGIQLDNQTMMQLAQFGREGRGMDIAREDAGSATDFSRAMQLAQYGQQARGLDYGRDMDQQNLDFNRMMQLEQFNREGRGIGAEDQWRRYGADLERTRYGDETANQAQLFNIGQEEGRDANELNAFNQMMQRLSGYGSDSFTPQSLMNYDLYNQQRADQQSRFSSTMGLAGTAAGAYFGSPEGMALLKKLGSYGR